VPSGVDNPTFLYVQAPRRDDGSAAPYGYVGINFDGTTTQVVSGDLNSSDNIAAMGTNKWVDPDPSNNYWDPRDDDPLAIANSVIRRTVFTARWGMSELQRTSTREPVASPFPMTATRIWWSSCTHRTVSTNSFRFPREDRANSWQTPATSISYRAPGTIWASP